MTNKVFLTLSDVRNAACNVASDIAEVRLQSYTIFGVPRGGIIPAYMVAEELRRLGKKKVTVVNNHEEANVIIDDLIDSGATANKYERLHKNVLFRALFTKHGNYLGEYRAKDSWLVFPWEVSKSGVDESAHDIVVRLLEHIGEDMGREGLNETPARVVKAWAELYSGYRQNPNDVMKVFADGAETMGSDEMVVVGSIPVFSSCEHHILPFFGLAWIGYIPNGKVLGLSKFKRVLDVFARRLQVQERLTGQVADALQSALQPKGVGVVIKCRHMCCEGRGINVSGSETTTSALRGALLVNPVARQEFLSLCK